MQLSSKSLENTFKENHFLMKLHSLGFNSTSLKTLLQTLTKDKLIHRCFSKILIKSAEELHFENAFCSTTTFVEHHPNSPFTAANSNP